MQIRADLVDVYVFRRPAGGVEFLQLRRARHPMAGTWHPVMGHIQDGETATDAAARELLEETGLHARGPRALGFWQLEQIHPYFVAELDAVVISPRFAVEAPGDWSPALNAEHDGWKWTPDRDAAAAFLWPGQVAAVEEILRWIVPGGSRAAALRL